jgi:Na+-driven multidrug efflux pump
MPKKAEYMGTQPITRLFLGLALPISMGMLVNGLYNVVDAIFVTRVLGPAAMGGVSIVFPIQMFIFALASLISSGMASLVARNLGANQVDYAQKNCRFGSALSLADKSGADNRNCQLYARYPKVYGSQPVAVAVCS